MTHNALCKVLVALVFLSASVAEARARLELSVVTDWQTVTTFGSPEQARQAINSIVARTADLYEKQLGIELVLTYAQIPADPMQDDLPADTQPEFLLRSMQRYRSEHPKHRAATVTALISSRELHIGSKLYSGYANIGPVCSTTSVALVSMQSIGVEYLTLAHEIAHTLGASHDGEIPCENESRTGWIMAASGAYGADRFSACSVDVIKQAVTRFGDCINEPTQAEVGTGSAATATGDTSRASNGGGGSWDTLSVWVLSGVLLVRLAFGIRTRQRATANVPRKCGRVSARVPLRSAPVSASAARCRAISRFPTSGTARKWSPRSSACPAALTAQQQSS